MASGSDAGVGVKRRRTAEAKDGADSIAVATEEENNDEIVELSNKEYFSAYDDLAIHALMLGDAPRVGAYLAAIRAHRADLEGRTVLDVGAGSGVLSMLAAKYGGAKRVFAVEAAPGMARLARDLVERNGLQEVVTVFEGKVEEVKLPSKVDVLISEWMGFYLVHESMLESVLVARDLWLKPEGVMLPNRGRIWAAPVEAEELRREIEGYSEFHGLDFGPVGESELARRCAAPQVELVDPSRLLARPVLVADLGDLGKLKVGGTASFEADVNFLAVRSGQAAGVAFWFDVGFCPRGGEASQEVVLDTSPGAPPTHWKQTVVYFGMFAPVQAGDALDAHLTLSQSEDNPRHYEISVET